MSVIILVTAGLLLMLTRVIGVRQAMLIIMLMRPSCDRGFDWIKANIGQQSGPGAVINALMIALAMLAIVQVPRAALSSPLLAWAGLIAAAAISLLHTPDLSAGTRDVLDLVTYAAAFSIPYIVVKNQTAAAQCLTVALASSIVPSLYSLLELAKQPQSLTGEERLQSTFTHPNIYAFYIVGVLALILYMHSSATFRISPRMRRVTAAYAVYLVFLLLLTKTRSAWLSALLLMAGYSLVVDRRWLVPLTILPLALFVPGVSERLADLQSGAVDGAYEHLNSMAWREILWNDTLEWLAANPSGWFGYGLGSYQSYFPLFFARGAGQDGIGPHNAILQIYFEMGNVGLLSFAALMAVIAFRLVSRMRADLAGTFTMLLLCVGYLMMFYSDNLLDYLQFQWFFWFTIGTVCASTGLPRTALRPAPPSTATSRVIGLPS
ncbi:O-antigen ligase family protein [Bradyrhizobium sp. UFLA03-84]|uniref:O-antigen ligase family protein n=1 Tax=Bradyrhizobium sp. UFLA03-84 TaxID=418599 RepID=UPI0011787EB8|nr:O-antigen ligase family protein [Bradyrhizobium sp. UFLA03-84]